VELLGLRKKTVPQESRRGSSRKREIRSSRGEDPLGVDRGRRRIEGKTAAIDLIEPIEIRRAGRMARGPQLAEVRLLEGDQGHQRIDAKIMAPEPIETGHAGRTAQCCPRLTVASQQDRSAAFPAEAPACRGLGWMGSIGAVGRDPECLRRYQAGVPGHAHRPSSWG